MKILVIIIRIMLALPLYAQDLEDSTVATLRKTGVRVQSVTLLSPGVLKVAPAFFQADRFELLGKLMTVFQEGDDKAYAIKRLGPGLFSIRSRRTIRQGSTLSIAAMDKDHFIAYANLNLKKGVSFSCIAVLEAWYTATPSGVRCSTVVAYEAPLAVKGIDRGMAFFTGMGFVGRKTAGFIERMNVTMERAAALSTVEWRRMSGDSSALASLFFPVVFTGEEKHFITKMLETPKSQK